MAEHFVKIVENGTLSTKGGWAFAVPEDTGEVGFIAEERAVLDERVLSEAWVAAKQLVIEQAVRNGIVNWAEQSPAQPGPQGGRRAAL